MSISGTSRPVIEVSGIRKTYGATVAVSDVSFEVSEGEIFGLIGPNGAGKTTTMECLEGVRRPDRGAVSILGLDPLRDVYQLQNHIGVQLQQAHLQKRIKVWEAVDLWGSLYSKAVDGAADYECRQQRPPQHRAPTSTRWLRQHPRIRRLRLQHHPRVREGCQSKHQTPPAL